MSWIISFSFIMTGYAIAVTDTSLRHSAVAPSIGRQCRALQKQSMISAMLECHDDVKIPSDCAGDYRWGRQGGAAWTSCVTRKTMRMKTRPPSAAPFQTSSMSLSGLLPGTRRLRTRPKRQGRKSGSNVLPQSWRCRSMLCAGMGVSAPRCVPGGVSVSIGLFA
jgi:hypothetical protein